jgi:hypothetical protein
MAWRLEHPWALALALPLGWLAWRASRRPAAAAAWSDAAMFDFPAARAGRVRWLWLPAAWRHAAWLAAALGLARPHVVGPAPPAAPVLAVALDISGSMGARDDQPTPRLARARAAAKAAAAAWPGEVALVAFAADAEPRCLPTADRAAFARVVDGLRLADDDNRTDLGAGLAEALALLDNRRGAVLLVTDGAQRLPDGVAPLGMARVAEALGVPVHAQGVGDFSGPYAADAANLRLLASRAGGECALEPARVHVPPPAPPPPALAAPAPSARRGTDGLPWCAAAAGVALLAEALTRALWLRVRPADA